MYRQTQEVVGRVLERFVGPFWIEEGEREKVTGCFSVASPFSQVFILISDS